MDNIKLDLEKASTGAKVFETAETTAENTTVETQKATTNTFVNNLATEDDETCLAEDCVDDIDEAIKVSKEAIATIEKASTTTVKTNANTNTNTTSSIVQVKSSSATSSSTSSTSSSSTSSSSSTNSAVKKAKNTVSTKLKTVNSQISIINSKISYLGTTISKLEKKLNTAIQNEDDEAQYVLEQQLNGAIAQQNYLAAQCASLENIANELNEYNNTLTEYPNNTKIANIINQKANLVVQFIDLSEKKCAAMQNEDEYAQYIIEQEECKLNVQIKKLKISQAKLEAEADGRTFTDEEASLIAYNDDIAFRKQRILEKQYYLQSKVSEIAQQKIIAMQNGDEEAQYVLEQQENSIPALNEIFNMDQANIEAQEKNAEEALAIVQKYSNNKDIVSIAKEKVELKQELLGIALQKSTAMQNEDEYAQYVLEQQENEIYTKLTELEVKQNQAIAKEEGRTVSDTETKLIEQVSTLQQRLDRLKEKREYLSYKAISIAQQKTTAMDNEDEYNQYILEQQETAINALDKIFEMDQTALESTVEKYKEYLAIVQKYPNNTEIQNVIESKLTLLNDLYTLSSEKSTAIQNEDENAMKELIAKEESYAKQDKAAEVKLQKLIAKEEGKTLSTSEISQIENNFDAARNEVKIEEIKGYINYKLIGISQQKSTAKQNEDDYALYVLEQMENNLNELSNLSDSELLAMYDNYIEEISSILDSITENTPATESTPVEETSWSTKYTYDSQGRCTQETYYDEKGNYAGKETYEYDDNGNCISQNVYDENNGLVYTYKNTYDKNNNQVASKVYDSDGNLNDDTSNIYGKNGNLLYTKNTTYNADGSYYKRTHSYSKDQDITDIILAYNANGKLNYTVRDNYTGNYPCVNCWGADSAYLYFSDKKYIEITTGSAVVINTDGTVEVTNSKGTTKYNKNGQKIS